MQSSSATQSGKKEPKFKKNVRERSQIGDESFFLNAWSKQTVNGVPKIQIGFCFARVGNNPFVKWSNWCILLNPETKFFYVKVKQKKELVPINEQSRWFFFYRLIYFHLRQTSPLIANTYETFVSTI